MPRDIASVVAAIGPGTASFVGDRASVGRGHGPLGAAPASGSGEHASFGDVIASFGDDIASFGDVIASFGDDIVSIGSDRAALVDGSASVTDVSLGFASDRVSAGRVTPPVGNVAMVVGRATRLIGSVAVRFGGVTASIAGGTTPVSCDATPAARVATCGGRGTTCAGCRNWHAVRVWRSASGRGRVARRSGSVPRCAGGARHRPAGEWWCGGEEGRMNRIVRSKLEMAVRVRDFSRAHPSADANYASIVGRLEALIVRMQALARQQQAGFLARSSASARRLTLRWRIHDRLLRHLVTVAEVAARERPALTKRFRLPDGRDSHEAFVTLARELLEQGRSEYELLVRHGLAERLLDDLASALDAFDASVTAFNEARREHVGARAELDAVSREVMTLVTLLDGLNRYRFPEGGELRAAWESARKLGSYRRAREEGAGEVTVRGVGSEQ